MPEDTVRRTAVPELLEPARPTPPNEHLRLDGFDSDFRTAPERGQRFFVRRNLIAMSGPYRRILAPSYDAMSHSLRPDPNGGEDQ
jgi:hypothetical protein